MHTQRINLDNEEVDLKPYLDNNPIVIAADWLHRTIFQPIDDLIDYLDAHFTKKLVEENLPEEK